MSSHGLSDQHLTIIKQVFAPYAERIEKVGLFGSRATGKYRDNSDIDMVIYGDLTEAEIDRLHTMFEESLLPYRVDVNAYDLVEYTPLKAHIDATMQPLFHGREVV